MSGGVIVGETLYMRQVRDAVEAIRMAGVEAFTPQNLADHMGRKVTQHMRGALETLRNEGVILSYRFYTDKGGLAKAFMFPVAQPINQEHAF